MKHTIPDDDAMCVDESFAKRPRHDEGDQSGIPTCPYFHYQDFSEHPNPDPLMPLTAPGRVPNFLAKMHAILSRDDLSDIISWMPHGRAWKVHKPRDFEISVLSTYFEHSKYSSFIRQANGWGFRRINSGRDRNCYYHPQFLRGLPHLCKSLKRPGVANKLPANPDHEPDLYRISELHPVPERSDDKSILLLSTLNGGPKARISLSSILPHNTQSCTFSYPSSMDSVVADTNELTPHDREVLSSFYSSLGKMDTGLKEMAQDVRVQITPTIHQIRHPLDNSNVQLFHHEGSYKTLATAHQLAFAKSNFSNL